LRFSVRPVDVAELGGGDPDAVARDNALRKALAAARAGAHEAVLGVDTLVTLDGRIYGKPADEAQARAILQELGGATHHVVSGVALLLPSGVRAARAATAVTFRELSDRLLDWYLATDEWRDRAGGYAIQGAGAALVRRVEGDYENVVGLPVSTLLDLYPELFGLEPTAPPADRHDGTL
jgi:nucleoside triphosphate pyrophosphatase